MLFRTGAPQQNFVKLTPFVKAGSRARGERPIPKRENRFASSSRPQALQRKRVRDWVDKFCEKGAARKLWTFIGMSCYAQGGAREGDWKTNNFADLAKALPGQRGLLAVEYPRGGGRQALPQTTLMFEDRAG